MREFCRYDRGDGAISSIKLFIKEMEMPSGSGLLLNFGAASSSPSAWWLARRSITRHGAIQHIDELTEFTKIIRGLAPRYLMEIGTAQGGVFWLFCQISAPDATLISLDLPANERHSGGLPIETHLQRMARPRQTVHAVLGSSHQEGVQARVKTLLNGAALDLLFIDGDHSYDGVRQDYEMYKSFVRPGGLIAFHDIVHTPWPECNVDRLWEELAQDRTSIPKAIIGRRPSGFGGIGVLTA